MENKIRIIAIDDHHLIRAGIKSVLEHGDEIELIAEGNDGNSLERLVKEHRPDVVLLDIEMPQDEGAASKREIGTPRFRAFPSIAQTLEQYPDTKIIIVSQHATQALVEGALKSGVRGYLLKDDALSLHLLEAVRAVALGGLYFSNDVSQLLAQLRQNNKNFLTNRQIEVLQCIVAKPNSSYAQHAQKLNISEHTFSNHLRSIFERLEVTNITAAVIKAVQEGIVSF